MRRSAALFFAADFTSLLGNSAIGIALPWLVLLRTGDAAAAGVVAALSAVPGLLAAIVGGSLIDRFGRRRMTIVADVGSAIAVALLPIVDLIFGLGIGWFIALGILGALFDVPGMTARESMIPDIARASGMSLDRVASIRESLFGVSFLAGPAIAGVALTLVEPTTVLWLTAACSGAAALLTVLLPRSLGAKTTDVVLSTPRAWLAHVGEGFSVLRSNRVALAVTLLGVASVLTISPLQAIVMPVFFQALDAPQLLGFTLSTVAVGMISGSLLYGTISTRVSRRSILVAALLVSAVGLVVFALVQVPWVVMVAAVWVGFGFGALNPLFPVLIAERVPESVRGRVLGLQNAGYLTAFPIGVFVIGFVVQQAGAQVGSLATAGVWLLFVTYGLTTPALRDLQTPEGFSVANGGHGTATGSERSRAGAQATDAPRATLR